MRRDHDGQAMAEFALVLPMLALLTFGTIEVALYLQQQSSLNAAAFMAARSASVLGGDKEKTKDALRPYLDASPPWLGRAVAGMKTNGGSGVQLIADSDRFSGLISGLTGGEVHGFDKLGAGATLPMEYEPKRHGNAKTGPKPRFLFQYRQVDAERKINAKAVNGAKKAVGMVKELASKLFKELEAGAKPPAPPSGGGTGNPPANGGPPGGGQVVTPFPPLTQDIREAFRALAVLDPRGEAYTNRWIVMSNPKKTTGGNVSSLFYVGPEFEARGVRVETDTEWGSKNVIASLKKVERKQMQDLATGCTKIGGYVVKVEPVAPPALRATIKRFKQALQAATKPLTTQLQAEYKIRRDAERTLFR